MKAPLFLAALVFVSSAATPSVADTKSYRRICDNTRLTSTERAECKARFDAATTDAERKVAFRIFDLRIAGFAPDGSRLSKADTAPAIADAKK
jgi:hypothetical protein